MSYNSYKFLTADFYSNNCSRWTNNQSYEQQIVWIWPWLVKFAENGSWKEHIES